MARKRIAKLEMVTEQGKQTLLRAVVGVDVLEKVLKLPTGRRGLKRRTEKVVDLLVEAMDKEEVKVVNEAENGGIAGGVAMQMRSLERHQLAMV